MTVGQWILLAVVVLVGIGGLDLAAHGGDPATFPMGMLLFFGAVAYAFALIKRVFDERNGAQH